jgi:hypothetical protein
MASGGGVRKNTLRANLLLMARNYPEVVSVALGAETAIETKEAKRRTPVDRGELKDSVRMEGPFRAGKSVYYSIVAGNERVTYAAIVHEDPDAFHRVGQWKYIESVINESREWLLQRVAARAQLSMALK